MRADTSVVQKVMASLSHVLVKRGGRGLYSFCVSGRSVWGFHSVGSGELMYGVLCAPLGSIFLAQGGLCRDLGVVGSESSSGLE